MNDSQQVLRHYNSHFDNQKYQAIANQLAQDLRCERESMRFSDTMNLITNAALQISGHPHYEEACLKLAIFCSQNKISVTIIDRIADFLRGFQINSDTIIDNFEATAKAILRSYVGYDTLHSAATMANGIHSWQGRVAYHILVATEYLTQAAIHLLMHGNSSYIHEKLGHGIRHLGYAFREGISKSNQPEHFDFSAADFSRPTKQ